MYSILNKIIEVKNQDEDALLYYLSKFILQDIEPKETCCNKFCLRNSGRHCNNCPDHPMYIGDGFKNQQIIDELNACLQNRDFANFLFLLIENNFPYPEISELDNLIS